MSSEGFDKQRVPALDGIRGLAILLVMFHHFTLLAPQTGLEAVWAEIAEMGRYGVDLFFVLSGFLITQILVASRRDVHYFRNFYIRRVLRIFPLYYSVVIFCLAILPPLLTWLPMELAETVRSKTVAGHWLWYAGYGSNFLIAIQNKYTHGVLDVTWSLAIEEHFYLIWPTVVYFFGNDKLKKICFWAIAASLILRALLWSAGFSRLQIYMLTFTRIDMLMFGAMLAIHGGFFQKKLFWFSLTGAAILGLSLAGGFGYESAVMNTVGYTLVGLFFMQLIGLAAHPEIRPRFDRFFSAGVLRFFGKYSYALYLFHLPAAYFTEHVLFRGAGFHSLPGLAIMWQFIFYAVAGALSVLAALISWRFLEAPALSLKQKFTTNGTRVRDGALQNG